MPLLGSKVVRRVVAEAIVLRTARVNGGSCLSSSERDFTYL